MPKPFEYDDVEEDEPIAMSDDSKKYLEHLSLIKEWRDTEWLPEDFSDKK